MEDNMADTNGNGQSKKAWGRRGITGLITIALVTGSYYICMFKGMPLDWFAEYSKVALFILGFVAGTLTITDAITAWKAK
jgi:hypothetical protein